MIQLPTSRPAYKYFKVVYASAWGATVKKLLTNLKYFSMKLFEVFIKAAHVGHAGDNFSHKGSITNFGH